MPNTNKSNNNIWLQDGLMLFWEDPEKKIPMAAKIMQDTDPMDPRADMDNISTLALFHKRRKLGDDTGFGSGEDFWEDQIRSHIGTDDILRLVRDGLLAHIQDVDGFGSDKALEDPMGVYGAGKKLLDAVYDAIKDGSIRLAVEIAEKTDALHVEPVYGYEHSGLALSAGKNPAYPFTDRFDAGLAGWAVVKKNDALQLQVRTEEPDGAVKYVPADDSNWRQAASQAIDAEIQMWNQYESGDVYGYELYSLPGMIGPEAIEDGVRFDRNKNVSARVSEQESWTELGESCWGFFGDELYGSGIPESIGHGLPEALASGQYQTGKSEARTVTLYQFVRDV